MRDVEISSSAIVSACPEKITPFSLRAWIARFFRAKPSPYIISEHSPEYLLRDVGIKEGRPSRFNRDGHKLPEW
ncbi:hypothetical protein [Ochrobactrum sp. MYb379]|uniref:hypothetical protein n=1 Tax=Ochrobactrum sp. MYb379 TaxID=2745275 RepID=UPI0030ABB809